MKQRDYFFLWVIALIPLIAVAAFQRAPGYMDADYYTLTGQELAEGRGFSEPVLWNYLDEPQGLPHPSHAYWAPLPSLLAAASMALFGASFAGGRVLFILLAAAAAPLSAALAWKLASRRDLAWIAGGLAALPGFYLPYLSTIETFAPGIVLGGLFFLLTLEKKMTAARIFALGAISGLINLNRAEGLLWLAAALILVWKLAKPKRDLVFMFAGYLLVMAPWFLRNWAAFHSLSSPAVRTLWLMNYDQLFSFPATQINFENWIASGWGTILAERFAALGQNLLSGAVVGGFVVLTPLVIWGLLKKWKLVVVRTAAGLWVAMLLALSFLFPFSAVRGGFFHAAAGLQVMVWALAAVGLAAFVDWGKKQRGWKPKQALRIFGIAALVLALGLSAYSTANKLPSWNASADHYAQLGQQLDELGVGRDAVVMVNNPPGFALATGRSAIVIPDGSVQESAAAAREFGASVLLLEANHPSGWNTIYATPQILSSIQYVESYDGTQIFYLP